MRASNLFSIRLLRELDAENEMAEAVAVHLLAGLCGVGSVRVADEGEALGPARLPVLGQEDAGDVSEPREHIAQVLLLGELGHVGNAQGGEVVALELAAHLLAATAAAAPEMRGHVASGTSASAAGLWCVVGHLGGSRLVGHAHGVLEGTFCGEMVAAADSALDLGLLQIRLLLVGLVLVIGARFPVCGGAEDNVLGDTDGIGLRASRPTLLLTKLLPVLALGDARVHDLLDNGLFDAAGSLDLLAIFADGVCDYGLASVLVLDDLILRQLEGRVFIVVGPIRGVSKDN